MSGRRALLLRRLALAGAMVVGTLLVVGVRARREAARPDRRLAVARQALAEDQYERAEAIALLLERAGEGDRARLIRAESLRRLAQDHLGSERGRRLLVGALGQLEGLKDEGPLRLQAAVLTGQCLLDLRELGEAARAFSYAIEQDAGLVDAHRGLAAVYYDLGALRKAAYHLGEVARLDPGDGRPYRLLGLIHKDLDEQEPAVVSYGAALERALAPGAAQDVRLELAEVLARQTRYAEALEALKGLEEERAGGARARAVRVESLWGLGEIGPAEEEMRAALRDHPRAAPLLVAGAKVQAGAGRPREAVGLLERAVGLNPHDYASRYQLAAAYTAVGRSEEAAGQREQAGRLAKALDELTRLNREADERPWDAGPRRRMAELCAEVGRAEEAAMWRQAAAACALPGLRPGTGESGPQPPKE